MQTNDYERIGRVIKLAEETLPLKEIASGPSESLGLGPEFKHHKALDFLCRDFDVFLVKAGHL
jgi:hypothetical protein